MATNGAAMQMFNHGIITGGLFFLVGVIYERAHVRDLALKDERRTIWSATRTTRSSPPLAAWAR